MDTPRFSQESLTLMLCLSIGQSPKTCPRARIARGCNPVSSSLWHRMRVQLWFPSWLPAQRGRWCVFHTTWALRDDSITAYKHQGEEEAAISPEALQPETGLLWMQWFLLTMLQWKHLLIHILWVLYSCNSFISLTELSAQSYWAITYKLKRPNNHYFWLTGKGYMADLFIISYSLHRSSL